MALGAASSGDLDSAVVRVATTVLPTRHGTFDLVAYEEPDTGTEHVALVLGRLADPLSPPPLVRLHSECLTGDALGSFRCDCGEQLDASLALIARQGRGAVLYMRGHEGRGIGLGAKLRAYALQDTGVDTVDANTRLGYLTDARKYGAAAHMLRELDVQRIVLVSSNPAKEHALEALGIEVVRRAPLIVAERAANRVYLETKRARMGHDRPLSVEQVWSALLAGAPPAHASGAAADLVDRYGDLAVARDTVLAQLGQSADGFIAARSGDAVFVTGEEDREHLHRLRALVDGVVVGVGTVVADDCRLTPRSVPGEPATRVVLDGHGRCPRDAHVLTVADAPTLWLRGPGCAPAYPPAAHVEVVELAIDDAGRFPPSAVLDLLRGRGLRRILVEGGGRTVSDFVAAGVVDRLWLTIAPVLIGDGVPGLRFEGSPRMADALRPPVRRFPLGADLALEFALTPHGSRPAPR